MNRGVLNETPDYIFNQALFIFMLNYGKRGLFMILIKNMYRKTLFKISNDEVLNQSGKLLATVSDEGLINLDGQLIVKVKGTQVYSVTEDIVIATVEGSAVKNTSGSIIGYVDGSPNRQFALGAAALVMFAY